MIEVVDKTTGQLYRYDPESRRLFRDGIFMTPQTAEPVYSGNQGKIPTFAGIYLPNLNSIVTLSGNVKQITPLNKIR